MSLFKNRPAAPAASGSGAVLRTGAADRVAEPGLHFKLPFVNFGAPPSNR